MKLSIIIPAYNVGKFINKCIQSLLKQDLPLSEYEIIIVDDGSKDDTYQKALELASKFDNVFAFTQTNQGQSGARNNALDKAKGEYVWFVDGDDYVIPNCFNKLYSIAKQNDLDALYFLLQRHYEGMDSPSNQFDCSQPSLPVNTIITGVEAVIGGYNPCSSCAAIYKLQKLNEENLRFVPRIFRQDVEFTYRSIPTFNRIMFLQNPYYIYYTHPDTVTTSNDVAIVTRKMSGDGYVAASCLRLANNYEENQLLAKTFRERYQGVIIGAFIEMLKHHKEWRQKGINRKLREKYEELHVYPIMGPYKNLKFRIIATFFNTFGKFL